MLTLKIRGKELWDEKKEEFVYTGGGTINLEHSLISVSKWEEKYRRSFLSSSKKTAEEMLDYIKFMVIGEVDETLINNLSKENVEEILKYIEDPMTATYLREDNNRPPSSEKITSELIYYWMIATGVPFECQYWHLNRLMTLIKVCAVKSNSGKHSKRDMLRSNSSMNAARRARLGSKG